MIRAGSRRLWLTLALVPTLAFAGLLAQGGQAPTPPGPGNAGGRAAGAAPAPGRGGGRGALGGPERDDPANANVDYSKKPPVLALTPEEQAKRFVLPPGYRMELVLADPDIKHPTAIAFDGNGRLFVLENRGYMRDADGIDERAPIGRISMHADTNGDGSYDKHTVFADGLVFPRFMMPFGPNTILAKESDAQEVWKFTDTNDDGVADKKELFDTGYGRVASVEHQEAFLTWGLDNWLYSTFNAFRSRWTPHGVVKEPTGQGGAQWGLAQDNDGKIWYQGGASGQPSYFQFPIVYGNFAPPNTEQMAPEFGITWGAPIRLADMQGGTPAVRMPDGSLIGTTAGAGGDVFRGDRLPKDLVGDYTYGEVVARVVRRVHPENREGLTVIHNAYPNSEFIKSLDPLFRPVDQATAPDGTLYIADMYQGIIQQATWTPRGTYLRAKIEQYDLDKVIDRGRIWRVTYDGIPRDRTPPRMYQESSAQLVAHLSHPNGWWRDTAQQTLVLRQDKSIAPALTRIVRTSPNLLGRFHAMWTLEGLGSLTPALVREAMKDPEPRMRIQAIRASETLFKAGDRSFADDYRAFTKDSSVDVVIQTMLTMNKWNVPDANAAVTAAMAAHKARGVQFVGNLILNPAARGRVGGGAGAVVRAPFSAAEQATLDRGGQIYAEVCAACHGTDAMGTPRPGSEAQGLTMAPPLAGSPRVTGHRDYAIGAILRGVTGPVDDKSYLDVMIPQIAQDDEWIAAVTSYIRNSFGNDAPFVSATDVARRRPTAAARKSAWTVEELVGTLPVQVVNDGGWKVTASHNQATAPGGLTLSSWNSGVPQQPGMWYQVEMSKPATIGEIQFESSGTAIFEVVNTLARAAVGAANRAEASRPAMGPLQFPRGYQVQVSMDGTTWSAPVAQGQGTGGHTVITFAPVQAKFVRITQTATVDTPVNWAIQGLRLYQPGKP